MFNDSRSIARFFELLTRAVIALETIAAFIDR